MEEDEWEYSFVHSTTLDQYKNAGHRSSPPLPQAVDSQDKGKMRRRRLGMQNRAEICLDTETSLISAAETDSLGPLCTKNSFKPKYSLSENDNGEK